MKEILYSIFMFLGFYFIINSLYLFVTFVYENPELCADKLNLFSNVLSENPIFLILFISLLIITCIRCIKNIMLE